MIAKEKSKIAESFRRGRILVFFMQTALLSFSVSSFGLAVKTDPFAGGEGFSKNPSPEVQAVFFERKGASLFPKCRISSEKYPGVLPDFVKTAVSVLTPVINSEDDPYDLKSEADALSAHSAPLVDLEECGPDLSLYLTARAVNFELYPQLAFAPVIYGVGMSIAGCAIGGLLGAYGGTTLAKEHEAGHRRIRAEHLEEMNMEFFSYLPTTGEGLTAASPVLAGIILGAVNHLAETVNLELDDNRSKTKFARKLQEKTRKIASRFGGGLGFLCGVAGGSVGYLLGKTQIANQKREEAAEKAEELKIALSKAREDSLKLKEDLALAGDQTATLQTALGNATLREEQAQRKIQALEMEMELGEEKLHKENLKFTLAGVKSEIFDLKQVLNRDIGLTEELARALHDAQKREVSIQNELAAGSQKIQELEIALTAIYEELAQQSE